MSHSLEVAATVYEIALILGGLVLWWRVFASPAARANRRPSVLATWDAPISDFLLYLFLIMAGAVLAASFAGQWARHLKLSGDETAIFNTAAGQVGMLVGIGAFRFALRPASAGNTRAAFGAVLRAGMVTFLIAMPFLTVTGLVWQGILNVSGVPIVRQDLIGMFAKAESPWLLAVMIGLATITAPITEELVFRAGLFRYFRTRLPRLVALLLPAVLFAALHGYIAVFPSLVVLAVIFSLAYERTGHIGTTMVAHALFNLNTIVLIFCGVGV